jgi:UDP-N-acetylmuramoyl-L-alanyl-D-glutamate--2,6-diaminopimelate ligase
VRLSSLLNNIKSIAIADDRDVQRITLDSRAVQPGDLFIALKGTQQDGRKYIPNALACGAVAALLDADSDSQAVTIENGVPLIPLYQLQQKLGDIAARFYQHPAKQLRMIGVTGTNGKTSCTHFIAQCLQALHQSCGIIGTLGCGFYGALNESGMTTPDAVTLQATLQSFVKQNAAAVAMEVSSHSIDQGRVNGIEFEIGVFTNLTQDHLDYHGDMQTYAAVKKRFLAELPVKHLIINVDDDYGRVWAKELASHKSIVTYSATTTDANVHARHTQLTLQGMKAEIVTPWGEAEVMLPLIGMFNLSNVLAVVATLGVYGIPFKDILRAIQAMRSVPGRMQLLGGQQKPLVVVDYAHTPDALQNALQALRAHTQGRLVCVFGCGGDRDKGKRPLMAKIAEQIADKVIVTSDNPRHEDPQAIAAQIQAGFSHPESVLVELNRSKAIQNSIQWAEAADCVLVAGKGAEHYQQIGDQKLPFDDVAEVMKYL